MNNLPKVLTQLCPEQELNPRPVDRKSNALPIAPLRQSINVKLIHSALAMVCTLHLPRLCPIINSAHYKLNPTLQHLETEQYRYINYVIRKIIKLSYTVSI